MDVVRNRIAATTGCSGLRRLPPRLVAKLHNSRHDPNRKRGPRLALSRINRRKGEAPGPHRVRPVSEPGSDPTTALKPRARGAAQNRNQRHVQRYSRLHYDFRKTRRAGPGSLS